jgi:hypothetical protein
MLVHHNSEQARLRLSVVESFIQEELLDRYGQPCGARALGVMACPDTYHGLQSLPCGPCCILEGRELNL